MRIKFAALWKKKILREKGESYYDRINRIRSRCCSCYRYWSRYWYRLGHASKAVDAIARQPEADGKITKALLLGCALAEATAIYGFVIGLLIILFLK